MNQLPVASKEERRGGWVYSPAMLHAIYEECDASGVTVDSTEGVQEVLLALERRGIIKRGERE